MHGTFLQKVVLTLVAALCASGLIEAWKFTVRANDLVNKPINWQKATALP